MCSFLYNLIDAECNLNAFEAFVKEKLCVSRKTDFFQPICDFCQSPDLDLAHTGLLVIRNGKQVRAIGENDPKESEKRASKDARVHDCVCV